VVVGASDVSALVMSSSAPDCIDFLAASTRRNLELWVIDFESGGATMLSSHAWSNDEGAISADGRIVAYTAVSGSAEPEPQAFVVDTQSGEQTLIELAGTFVHDLDPLGELVLLEHDDHLKVWDVAAAEVVAESPAVVSGLHYAQFSRNGGGVLWTSDDGKLTNWPLSGADLQTFPAPQGGYPSATEDGIVLVPSLGTTSALLIDTTLRPEIAAVPLYEGWCWAWFYNALDVAGSNVAIDSDCDGVAASRIMDRDSLTVTHDLPDGFGMALSQDGSRLARQTAHRTEPDEQNEDGYVEVGSLEIVDLESRRETVRLEGLCAYNVDRETNLHLPAENPGCAEFPTEPFEMRAFRLRWSPDGSMLAAVDGTEGYWAVWNTGDGSLVSGAMGVARRLAFDVLFTADSQNLIVSYTGSAVDYGSPTFDSIESISTASWTVEGRRSLTTKGLRLELAGLSDDGSTMYAVSGVAGTGEQAIYWLATDSLEDRQPKRPRLHDGTLASVALNEHATLVATGSSDGTVRVWEAENGRLVHELTYPGNEVSAVAFVTDDHLGVLLADGNLRVVTMDTAELLAIVRGSLTRAFSEAECERFNFDPCPSLEEMRSGQ
jgi:WD40 repeat protein